MYRVRGERGEGRGSIAERRREGTRRKSRQARMQGKGSTGESSNWRREGEGKGKDGGKKEGRGGYEGERGRTEVRGKEEGARGAARKGTRSEGRGKRKGGHFADCVLKNLTQMTALLMKIHISCAALPLLLDFFTCRPCTQRRGCRQSCRAPSSRCCRVPRSRSARPTPPCPQGRHTGTSRRQHRPP